MFLLLAALRAASEPEAISWDDSETGAWVLMPTSIACMPTCCTPLNYLLEMQSTAMLA